MLTTTSVKPFASRRISAAASFSAMAVICTMVSTASSRYFFKSAMMAETSVSERFQFSVEKA